MSKPKNMQEYDGFSLPERRELSEKEFILLKKQFEEGMKKIRQERMSGELYE